MEENVKYAVITKFFDDGTVKVVGPLAFSGGEYRNSYEDRGNWDEYVDVFDDWDMALEHCQEAKDA